MSFLDRYFHDPVTAARVYLLSRALPLLLALDIWVLMVGHGARYGTAGFNVAHFSWLDAVQPIPTPALYTGVMLACGLLSLTIAFAGGNLWLSGALCLLYTFGWAMSMLDSYQHHYFISWLLLCLVFVPRVSASEIAALPAVIEGKSKQKQAQRERAEARESRGWIYALCVLIVATLYSWVETPNHPWVAFSVSFVALLTMTGVYGAQLKDAITLRPAWGYALSAATIAIAYTYTTIAKCDAQWVAGHTMRQISSAEQVYAGLADWAVAWGIERERFWALFSTAVIPLEALLAACYLVAVTADQSRKTWPRTMAWLGFALAMQLHVGAEAMGLEIGWFSYYMMLLACVFLLPATFVQALATLFAWPSRALLRLLADWDAETDAETSWSTTTPMILGTACVVGVVGYSLDLPGSQVGALSAAAIVGAVVGAGFHRTGHAAARRTMLGLGASAAVMWIAVNVSSVRFDYYRFLGGDLRRREQPEAALDAYLKAERYAPPGESRKKDIDALKQQLGRD